MEKPAKCQGAWGGPLSKVHIAKHRMELIFLNVCPGKGFPYRTEWKERKLKKTEIDKMLRMRVIEPAQKEFESSVMIAAKEKSLQHFCLKNWMEMPWKSRKGTQYFANGQLLQLVRTSAHILNDIRQFGILKNPDWKLPQAKRTFEAALYWLMRMWSCLRNVPRTFKERWTLCSRQ